MSFGTILAKIAPELEAALPFTGPIGGIAAMAIKAVSAIVEPSNPSPTLESTTAALAGATPEQMLQLQKANDDFKVQMEQLHIDVLKLAQEQYATDASDRNSARVNFGGLKFVPQMVISGLFITGYFAMIFLDAFGKTNFGATKENLLAVLTLILNFWFGSSHSSQKKDDALAAAATS